MKLSLAIQQRSDYSSVGDGQSGPTGIFPSKAANPSSLELPVFRYDADAAANAKLAGRVNAASIPDSEHQELLWERQKLLDKKFEGAMTAKESNRLEYVRWTLDRIEDAKHGQALEVLEKAVSEYERLADQIQELLVDLNKHLPANRPHERAKR